MGASADRYEKLTREAGLSATHRQIIAWVRSRARVLEIGCSTGFVSERLIAKGCGVDGVEVDAAMAERAKARGVEVTVGSIEAPAVQASVAPGAYDFVIAADVLEHLRRPAAALRAARGWLAPGGRIIVAVPNMAQWTMRAELAGRGRFDYADSGLLDSTHLRFFTRATLQAMVTDCGLVVEDEMVDAWQVPGLQTLMYELPLAFRRRAAAPDLGGVRRQLYVGAGRIINVHQSLGRWLGRRWPGLCATHFALLLHPFNARAGPPGRGDIP